jgi:hypothetical protein
MACHEPRRVVLRVRITLIGRAPEETHGFRPILWHALALGVARAEIVLRLREAMIGRAPEEARGLRPILRYALSGDIAGPQQLVCSGQPHDAMAVPFARNHVQGNYDGGVRKAVSHCHYQSLSQCRPIK